MTSISYALLGTMWILILWDLYRWRQQVRYLRAVRNESIDVWTLLTEVMKFLDLHDDATARLLRAKIVECINKHADMPEPPR